MIYAIIFKQRKTGEDDATGKVVYGLSEWNGKRNE